jgi:hypothetical protein
VVKISEKISVALYWDVQATQHESSYIEGCTRKERNRMV